MQTRGMQSLTKGKGREWNPTVSLTEGHSRASQEEVLKQVQDTPLHKHITSLLISKDSVCQLKAEMDISLTNIAASFCCREADLFAARSGLSDRFVVAKHASEATELPGIILLLWCLEQL